MRDAIKVHVRWMRQEELPQVCEIGQLSFDFPWSEENYREFLRHAENIGLVAEYGETVVGFALYERCERHIHLRALAVHPEFRWREVGLQLVANIIEKHLSSNRRKSITLTVRESNLGAQLFFQALRFRAVRVLRGAYKDTGEDGYSMKYRLADRSQLVAGNRIAGHIENKNEGRS